MKTTSLNPNAPVYIPGGLVYGKDGPSGVLPSRSKSAIPTAKVPSYVKRLGQSVRDNKPGLLPTPSYPPMRAGMLNGLSYSSPYATGGLYSRSASFGSVDDPYATPYADKLRKSSSILDSAPPGFGVDNGSSTLDMEPSVAGDSLESLLALLSQQLQTGLVDSCATGASTGSSTVAPSTPLSMKPGDSLWDSTRLETFDSEQSLLASIAGFYLPSDMN
jgi:hypothetical protein